MEMKEEGIQNESLETLQSSRKRPSHGWVIVLLVVSNLFTYLLSTWFSPWTATAFSGKGGPGWESNIRTGISNELHMTTFTAMKYVPNNFSALPGKDIDVDAAWRSIGTYMDRFLVPVSEAPHFPEIKDTDMYLKPENVLSGPALPYSGYPVFLETFHQLHCVDLMRQALYFNADFYRSRSEGVWDMEEHWIQNHVNHCMDYLRRLAMCHAETGVITFSWRNPEGGYMLNYEQERQCGNFENVLKWAKDHEVDMNNGEVGLKPPKGATFKEPVG